MCIRDSDGTAEKSGFSENIGLKLNSPGITKNYFFVADNAVHIYKILPSPFNYIFHL